MHSHHEQAGWPGLAGGRRAGLMGPPAFNAGRAAVDPFLGAEEISPLRVSVLRIAVRQAHTSNALIPRRPALM
jgi:hypothetical protein